ncbi:MAG: hypothetical protein JJU48_09955 [Methylophaga sp.]|nr:hypothetical protein [Methylophaga sp.]
MKRELQEEIFSKCPIIYRHRFAGPEHNLMCFGFDCGSGWFEIILELSIDIEKVVEKIKANGLDETRLPMVTQVKEKYGGLNFYMRGENKEISALIHRAAKRSVKTCEKCGSPGKFRNIVGWYVTECQACFDERDNFKNQLRRTSGTDSQK